MRVLVPSLWLFAWMGVHGAAGQTAPKPAEPEAGKTSGALRVAMDVQYNNRKWGRLVVELDAERAPQTVANFVRYAEAGFYDNTIIHRLVPGFLMQGGGYTRDMTLKTEGLHEPIPNEARGGLPNTFGTIAMARARDPHSATSQFFINLADNPALDPDYPDFDGWGYCVFGRVVEGQHVLARARTVQTRPNPLLPSEKSSPISPLVITSARVYRVDEEPGWRTPNPRDRHTEPARQRQDDDESLSDDQRQRRPTTRTPGERPRVKTPPRTRRGGGADQN
jgi:cyclophilin family peptidyl-prolyl cis-trans isomerase